MSLFQWIISSLYIFGCAFSYHYDTAGLKREIIEDQKEKRTRFKQTAALLAAALFAINGLDCSPFFLKVHFCVSILMFFIYAMRIIFDARANKQHNANDRK